MVEIDLTKIIIFTVLSTLILFGFSFYFRKNWKLSLVISLSYLLIFILYGAVYTLLKDTIISFSYISLSGGMLTTLFFSAEVINIIERGYKNAKFPLSIIIITLIIWLLPVYFYPVEILQTLLISFLVYLLAITTLHISIKYIK